MWWAFTTSWTQSILDVYPELLNIVSKITMDEIDANKTKAEEYVELQIDMHKRFVNHEHVEFTIMTQGIKKDNTSVCCPKCWCIGISILTNADKEFTTDYFWK